ncbi:MAG TPA: polyphenol oxidase family protein [Longimicrobiales bacterium]
MRGSSGGAPRAVREVRLPGAVPLYVHPEWSERFPWLVQGTTGRGDRDAPFDLRLFGAEPSGAVLARWRRLREASGLPRAVHAPQVHGADILVHPPGPPGLFIGEAHDGHATRTAGTLLTISVADCIPVSIVDPERRAIALVHGGWRGVAAGVVEAGITVLGALAGSEPQSLYLHLGPAICGECYEVGPEVFAALGLDAPPERRPIDLRAVAAARAAAAGVALERITVSSLCTRCDGSAFFSHRGGSAERQVGILGIREQGKSRDDGRAEGDAR